MRVAAVAARNIGNKACFFVLHANEDARTVVRRPGVVGTDENRQFTIPGRQSLSIPNHW